MRILRNYFFWTYERGSFHYDVMVTLILLFLFISPHLIDFNDRPLPELPARASEVLVRDAGSTPAGHRFVYEVRIDHLEGIHTDADLHARLADIVQTIGGNARIESVKPVNDPRGRVVAYDATVLR